MTNTRESNKKKYLRYAAIVFLVLFLLSVALLLLDYWEKQQGVYSAQYPDSLNPTIRYDGQEYILKDDIETYLVMGLDKFGEDIDNTAYNNDQQADFMMLFVVDNANASYTAIHINRDTMAEMNILGVAGEKVGTVTKQIALSHTYGNGREVSCRNAADAVSKLLLNAKVNHYISLTMDSVPVYNDLVGGIEVTVLDDFTGIDDTLIKGETVTLFGEHALTYVRSRYGIEDSSNDNRMNRQRQYVNALYEKTTQLSQQDEEFIVNASLTMADYLVSDCTINQLQNLYKKISAYEFAEIRSMTGEFVLGEEFMEFYPDEKSIEKIVVELFYQPKD